MMLPGHVTIRSAADSSSHRFKQFADRRTLRSVVLISGLLFTLLASSATD